MKTMAQFMELTKNLSMKCHIIHSSNKSLKSANFKENTGLGLNKQIDIQTLKWTLSHF